MEKILETIISLKENILFRDETNYIEQLEQLYHFVSEIQENDFERLIKISNFSNKKLSNFLYYTVYFMELKVISNRALKMPCSCCGNYTIGYDFDICAVCFWEEEMQSLLNIEKAAGGANRISLKTARENYISYGVSDEIGLNKVRNPIETELPENNELAF